ncbi:MAG: hypothetical protein K6T55_08560, partial [Syntrophobacterales bacterium]|nr:hypothetical protein [Syntrophobacterales bacterium]
TLVSQGVDLATVQALLTHKDFKTTQRYAHLSPSTLRKAVEQSVDFLVPTITEERKEGEPVPGAQV